MYEIHKNNMHTKYSGFTVPIFHEHPLTQYSRSENTQSQTVGHFSRTFSCPTPQESTGQIMLKLNNTRIFMHVRKTE